jgi:hypothetical protein
MLLRIQFVILTTRLTCVFSMNPMRWSVGVGDLPGDVAVKELGGRVVSEGVCEIHGDLQSV